MVQPDIKTTIFPLLLLLGFRVMLVQRFPLFQWGLDTVADYSHINVVRSPISLVVEI
jgi:hypothetical protein